MFNILTKDNNTKKYYMPQYFKSIYYSDYPSEDSKDKSITLAFNETEAEYYTNSTLLKLKRRIFS